jgi:hypothetical protein
MRNLTYLIGALLVLSAITACVSQSDTKKDVATNSTKPTATPTNSSTNPTPNSSANPQSRPATKTLTDEWTQKPLSVKLYDQEVIPFTTYFLEDEFIVDSAGAGEGTGVWFYSKVDGKKYESAYIHFFFPAKAATLEQMRKDVIGKRGLMETNKWTVKRRTQDISFSWAKERIDFEQPKEQQSIIGTVYIGEYNGKAFRVTEHFPADYGDGFAPRANIILKELQLRDR